MAAEAHPEPTDNMANILIVYSTTDGHTLEICRRIKSRLENADHQVSLVAVEQAGGIRPADFDRVVIGASIRYGKHRPAVTEFIRNNRETLSSAPNVFFSVNLVARKPAKNRPDTNPYVRKFLTQIPWQPAHVAIFAGKLDYPRYGFWDRNVIRLIMWMTKGPTDPATVKDFTDYHQVDELAEQISANL
jgi:menaquinone-dependent protoporphyrinogen oxidase